MSIDACLHSVFGASKVAADVMCQEFGRYFHMPVGIFRGGCLTGPQHAAVELHGYLTYIVSCADSGRPYTIWGTRANRSATRFTATMWHVCSWSSSAHPRCGEVYNLGGGRQNSISILETLDLLAGMGFPLKHEYNPTNRIGDHICYISDLSKTALPLSRLGSWNMTCPRFWTKLSSARSILLSLAIAARRCCGQADTMAKSAGNSLSG